MKNKQKIKLISILKNKQKMCNNIYILTKEHFEYNSFTFVKIFYLKRKCLIEPKWITKDSYLTIKLTKTGKFQSSIRAPMMSLNSSKKDIISNEIA